MRLDKYLKEAKIIKRRVIAQQLAKGGRILRNNISLKPSSNVKVGDVLEIYYGNKYLKVEVTGEKDYILLEKSVKRRIESEEYHRESRG
ncbi:RNA-binding S4 domain-containing protein [Thermosipho ferrireducens]|uniref:RNA-binding S4 domain-containing protein n=1 Tax=Thermosipho ferrireducens TaxID=2571116 RepID=A0ABX7S7X6_9BACT|nr:S4 domain-containing protein [Thermosipho ferrireducens]QTA37381.1 RNA-binding S4 domain-containing protein [Thermosipho ferrireducens]